MIYRILLLFIIDIILNRQDISIKGKIVEWTNDHKPDVLSQRKRVLTSKEQAQPFEGDDTLNIEASQFF
ncbi:unnamed protein product [Paramecium octaurelia]|uniref:Uncharacterized protein n=1 Tax=Paramecium octaurelia TaxID=43137 RepID=A0A8S1UMC5_PAROT|nr:unnamed protein product [Paramecium octaurelia]